MYTFCPVHARYYTRFLLKPRETGCAREYTGVVELSQPVDSVLDPEEIETILAKNFNIETNELRLLNWSRLH